MPTYNLVEYYGDHWKSIWNFMEISHRWTACYYSKFWVIEIPDQNNTKKPANGNTKDSKISVPLKYLSNFWKYL